MTKKPPKPADRPRAPRFRAPRKDFGMANESIKDALLKISDAVMSEEDYVQESSAEKTDRGAGILFATNLENALRAAIIRRLNIGDDFHAKIFGYEAALGTFSRKIIMAHAIGLYGKETRSNLDFIRLIRNALAHAAVPVKFEYHTIANACAAINIPTRMSGWVTWENPEPDTSLLGLARFQIVCEITSHNLLRITAPRGTTTISSPFGGTIDLPQMPQSLP